MDSMTIAQIIEEENRLALSAKDRGIFNDFALAGIELVASNFGALPGPYFLFAAEIAAMRKHAVLAYLSALRLHRTQCALNLRIMLEFNSIALFALSSPDPAQIIGPDFGAEAPRVEDKTKTRAFAWLTREFPRLNARIRKAKRALDEWEAHGGIHPAGMTFDFDQIGDSFYNATFFDRNELIDYAALSLLQVGDFSIGVMQSILEVNKSLAVLEIRPETESRLAQLERLGARAMEAARRPGGPFASVSSQEL